MSEYSASVRVTITLTEEGERLRTPTEFGPAFAQDLDNIINDELGSLGFARVELLP